MSEYKVVPSPEMEPEPLTEAQISMSYPTQMHSDPDIMSEYRIVPTTEPPPESEKKEEPPPILESIVLLIFGIIISLCVCTLYRESVLAGASFMVKLVSFSGNNFNPSEANNAATWHARFSLENKRMDYAMDLSRFELFLYLNDGHYPVACAWKPESYGLKAEDGGYIDIDLSTWTCTQDISEGSRSHVDALPGNLNNRTLVFGLEMRVDAFYENFSWFQVYTGLDITCANLEMVFEATNDQPLMAKFTKNETVTCEVS